jgi:hypothetical protein
MVEHVAPEHVVDKLRSRIAVTKDGCWHYTGALTPAGYGNIGWSLGKRQMVYDRTHRVMYQAIRGSIPAGLDLDHTCHDPKLCQLDDPAECPHRRCCNPDHLEPVTRRENLRRGGGMAAKRAAVTECPRGHAYDEENTMVDNLGRRSCRACVNDRQRQDYWRHHEDHLARNRAWREQNKDAVNAARRARYRQKSAAAKPPE